MRDFVILLSFAYLVDNVFAWIAAAGFSAWYLSVVSSGDATLWGGFIARSLAACLAAFLFRAIQGRSVNTISTLLDVSLGDPFSLVQIFVAVMASVVGTLGYDDVIELTGSPSPADLFYVGRVRSITIGSVVLILAYAALMMLKKGMIVRTSDTNDFRPDWYITLCVVSGGAIVVDLIIVQAFTHTWPFLVLLGAMWISAALAHI